MATTATQEPINNTHHKLLCWKSVFGGLLISIMAYMMLTALGAGVGGLTASRLINNDLGGSGLATGAGLWLGASALISLFMGSYFSLRISNFITNRVGAAHGFLIAAMFFILMMWGAGLGIGGLTHGVGRMAGAMGQGEDALVATPSVQAAIHDSLGSTALKTDPSEVADGLAVRLLRGDAASAKSYYAFETGLTAAEVDQRFNQLQNEFDQRIKVAADQSAMAVADAGWSLFVTFFIGLIAAVIGGRIGAQANFKRPIVAPQTMAYRTEIATSI